MYIPQYVGELPLDPGECGWTVQSQRGVQLHQTGSGHQLLIGILPSGDPAHSNDGEAAWGEGGGSSQHTRAHIHTHTFSKSVHVSDCTGRELL